MLKVRLSRIGKRGQAYFRVVVTEHTKKPKGEFLELLGTYNPHEKVLNVKKERIEYWISKGAQASPTVNNLLVNFKIWDKPKMQSWKPKAGAKAAAQAAQAAAAQAAAVPKPEAAPAAEEAPKEEVAPPAEVETPAS